MLIGTNGVVVDELAQVLLIRRNDTRTMAPPGGSLEKGELPADSLAREVREETGLIVMPVRLVGLYFVPLKPNGMLAFVFRCIQRGGQLGPTEEAPVVAFFPWRQLPSPMIPFHRQRLEHALAHSGGPPVWQRQRYPWQLRAAKFLLDNLVYRYLDLRRAWRKLPPYQPPTRWTCSAHMVLTDENDQVLWQRQADEPWALPGGPCQHMEPPWEALMRIAHELNIEVLLTDLSGVYFESNSDLLCFVFTARLKSRQQPADLGTFFGAEHEPTKCDPRHKIWSTDARSPADETVFRQLEDSNEFGDKRQS